MGGRAFAILAEVVIGLLVAGVIVGAIVPYTHGMVGPVGAALIGAAVIVGIVVLGEAIRRRPGRPGGSAS
jgi:hypothetical protein